MQAKESTPKDGVPITNATPGWAGWLFFLIGVIFLVVVYVSGFRPDWNPQGLTLFKRPDDLDLWVGTAVAVICFSGVGAAMLSNQAFWNKTRQWSRKLKQQHPDEPWRWRADWVDRRINPDRPAGQTLFAIWAGLCLLSALPGLEFWIRQEDWWPDHEVSYAGLGAAFVGTLVLFILLRRALKFNMSPRSQFHMNSELGLLGGPLEGAIEYRDNSSGTDFLVRLTCERHAVVVSQRNNKETTSLKVSTVYDDSYRVRAKNGLIPVRFGIPYDEPETSTARQSPVFLWLIELEDLNRTILKRFWVPVFKTVDSDPVFELADAAADNLIVDESSEACLKRHGITVDDDESDFATPHRIITVPPGIAWVSGFWLGVFGIGCLAVVGLFMNQLLQQAFGGRNNFDIAAAFAVIGVIAGGLILSIFGLVGFLTAFSGIQMLFERRRIELSSNGVRVRKSYFGLGWTSRLDWNAVKQIRTRVSSSTGKRRDRFENVVASIDGMRRKNGTMMNRNWSIINSVPAEAAAAAKTIIEEVMETSVGAKSPSSSDS